MVGINCKFASSIEQVQSEAPMTTPPPVIGATCLRRRRRRRCDIRVVLQALPEAKKCRSRSLCLLLEKAALRRRSPSVSSSSRKPSDDSAAHESKDDYCRH